MNKHLIPQEAAEYLRLAVQTVYDYKSKERIPYIKAGGKLLFCSSELDKWLSYGGDYNAAQRVMQERNSDKR